MALSNLAVRSITALIGAPIIFLLIWKGDFVIWKWVVVAITAISLFEFYKMVEKKYSDFKDIMIPGVLLGTLFSITILFKPFYTIFALPGMVVLTSAYVLFYFKDMGKVVERLGYLVIGIAYVSFLMPFFGLLIEHPKYNGRLLLIVLFLITWGNDTFAYFAGRFLGKHKLYEKMSPKKTVEGAVGGVIGGLVLTVAFKLFYFHELPLWLAIVAPLVIGPLGQMGDLVESMFKRYFGVKDSGNTIPGHGGFLDRLDSIMFNAPALFILFILF
ncbi:phosphatidate cytidylyltransferase [bacterium]|nr:phosphatidate cytidylyltransferase [bacterium]